MVAATVVMTVVVAACVCSAPVAALAALAALALALHPAFTHGGGPEPHGGPPAADVEVAGPVLALLIASL